MNKRPVIRIFHNMARSGGTMVSKCIGAMDNIRLFSEIHPAANRVEYLNVTDQAHRWYGLVGEDEVAANYEFVDGIEKILQRCEASGYQMVLRDWAVIDFLGKILVEEPSYKHRLNAVLAAQFDIHEISLVRHPLDQWFSTSRLKIYTDKLDSQQFFYGYLKYVKASAGNFVRYEDFTRDPMVVMRQICDQLALQFDPEFINRWYSNQCIAGDNKKSSRGSKGENANAIRPLPRREVDREMTQRVTSDPNYLEIVQLLDY